MTSPVEIKVEVPGKPYSVWVGAGLLERAGELLPLPDAIEVAVLIEDAAVAAAHGSRAAAGLAAACPRVEREPVRGGEVAKTLGRTEDLARALARSGVHRHDLIVGLGGGALGDLAGFVAATYHRGTAFALMPTTLLAMVDASIGGKTAVNIPEGKNLVGAFHQPIGVVADVTTLASLPDEELASGMAEVVKHGLIADAEILKIVAGERDAIAGRDAVTMTRLVARAAAVKARVVAEDETEQGSRAFLNYGHTLGHALESLSGFTRWRHGEAVAIGMHFAAHLAPMLGFADRVAEHVAAIEACGLPLRGAGPSFEDAAGAMRRDKKYRGGLRFVVLEDLGRPRLVLDVPEDVLRSAYERVRA